MEHRTGFVVVLAAASAALAWLWPIADRSPYASAAAFAGLLYLAASVLGSAARTGLQDEHVEARLVGFTAIGVLTYPASGWLDSLGPALAATVILWALAWALSLVMQTRRVRFDPAGGRIG